MSAVGNASQVQSDEPPLHKSVADTLKLAQNVDKICTKHMPLEESTEAIHTSIITIIKSIGGIAPFKPSLAPPTIIDTKAISEAIAALTSVLAGVLAVVTHLVPITIASYESNTALEESLKLVIHAGKTMHSLQNIGIDKMKCLDESLHLVDEKVRLKYKWMYFITIKQLGVYIASLIVWR